MKPSQKKVSEFLRESNAIECVYSPQALEDAKLAWQYAYKERNRIKSNEYVLTIHKLLMRRLNREIAGRFRKCAVSIGGKIKSEYRYLDRQILEWTKKTFVTDFDIKKKKDIWYRDDLTKVTHIEFEDIHPFADGNGRTGRILYNIHRLNLGLPLHIIHEGEEQEQYYEWFRHEDNVKFILDHYEDFKI